MEKVEIIRNGLFSLILNTEIELDSNNELVWNALIDLESYTKWNQIIKIISGVPKMNEILNVELHWPGLKSSLYKLEITKLEKGREFFWCGKFKLIFFTLMKGNHGFVIESISDQRVRLIHRESFSGLIVPFFAPWIKSNIKEGFLKMNHDFKKFIENK